MPANKSAIIRYRVIDQCLRNKMHSYPTKEYLRQKCEEALSRLDDVNISISTIEKDIAAMKDNKELGYMAPIGYDRARKGYYYTEADYSINSLPLSIEELEALKFAAVTLFQYRNISIFEYFKEAIDKIYTKLSLTSEPDDPSIDKFVLFEKSNGDKGTEWLQPLYSAIVSDRPVDFTYNNIYKKEQKQFRIVPYLLKEHHNHWYLIGWYEKHDCFLTFSLDRILQLDIIDKRVRKKKDFDPERHFQHTTGIMEGTKRPIKVSFEAREPVNKLILLQPMHPTQRVSKDKAGSTVFTMEVVQTPELIRQLLYWGQELQVITPKSLAVAMKDTIQQMTRNYK